MSLENKLPELASKDEEMKQAESPDGSSKKARKIAIKQLKVKKLQQRIKKLKSILDSSYDFPLINR